MGDAARLPAVQLQFLFAHEALGHCRACGYDIRAFASDAVCPECATPIAVSRASYLLADADPAWLRRIALGMNVFRWVAMISRMPFNCLVVVTIVVVLGSHGSFMGVPMPALSPPSWMPTITSMVCWILVLFLVLAVIGWCLVAERDPRDAQRPERLWPRPALRGLSALAILLWAASASQMTMVSGFGGLWTIRPTLLTAIIATVVASLAAVTYLRRIADRIPAPRWSASARRIEHWGRWCLPLLVLCWGTLFGVAVIAPSTAFRVPVIFSLIFMVSFVASLPLIGIGKLSIDVAKAVHQIRRDVAGHGLSAADGRV